MTVFARSATMALGLAASFPIAGEPVGQRSAQQLVVDAGVIVRQMEDAKRLAPCIRDSDRGGLLTNAERWIAAARASPHKDDRQVLERIYLGRRGQTPRLRALVGDCGASFGSGPPRRYDLRYPLPQPF